MKIVKVMLKVGLVVLALFSVSHFSFAGTNPAPFGLEIGRTTVEEMLEKYKEAKYVGTNKYSHGPQYEIDPRHIEFDGLSECTVIFGRDGKLVAVIATISKSKFNYVYQLMKSKYKVVTSRIPFVGDSYAKFVAGDTEIILDAPHLSFTMSLGYIHKGFVKAFQEAVRKETQEKIRKERSQL